MAGKREKPEQIASKLRQFEVLQGQGATIADGCIYRTLNIFDEYIREALMISIRVSRGQ